MVVNELDALKTASSGCQMVAFADLSAQMILVTDSGTNQPREVLDALCAEAATLLGSAKRRALGPAPSDLAVWATRDTVRVFLRAADEPNDVLCCICAPNVDVGKFVAKAAASLQRISSS